MASGNKKLHNIVLALGMILVLLGVAIAFLPPYAQIERYHFVLNVALVVVTAALVYVSLLRKDSVFFYISVNFCIFMMIKLILAARAVPMSLKQFWPMILVIFGITLLPVGRIHCKKFRTFYVIPSAVLTVLGVFYSLFTFKIIKIPMRVFFAHFAPYLFIMCGIVLIGVYTFRQKNKDSFPYIQDTDDEPLLFTEEDE